MTGPGTSRRHGLTPLQALAIAVSCITLLYALSATLPA
jgi:hypothetical protein